MMTLKDKFSRLKVANKKAFVVYVTYGFPNIALSEKIIKVLAQEADIVELGLPFSDPLADGPIIQEASEIALAQGANIDKVFSSLKKIKPANTPIAILTYYNPVFKYGVDKFMRGAKSAGISGVMIADLVIEEAEKYIKTARNHNIDTIFFVTPTTPQGRIKKIASLSRGFIYYISVTGITGPKALTYEGIRRQLKNIAKYSAVPVCVGFGIHRRKQVKEISSFSDGVIVGSAVIKFIKENYRHSSFLPRLKGFIRSLRV